MATETAQTQEQGQLFSLLGKFMNHLELKNSSKNSIDAYHRTLKKLVSAFPDDLPAPSNLNNWISESYSGMSVNSRRTKIAIIQSFVRFVKDESGIVYAWKPVKPKLTGEDTKLIFMQNDDIMGIIEQIRNGRDKLIIRFIYATGLRISETVSLDIEDLDLSRNIIEICGKGRKNRTVFFDDDTSALIIKYLDGRKTGPLFLNARGGRLTARSVQRSCNRYFPDGFTPHKLRHSFATNVYESSKDLNLVKNLLGHSSLSTTQIYLHASTEQNRNGYIKYHPLNKKISEE